MTGAGMMGIAALNAILRVVAARNPQPAPRSNK